MKPSPREIVMPVCPQCGHIGALPRDVARKDYCSGGFKDPHKQIRMQPVRFREVLTERKAAA